MQPSNSVQSNYIFLNFYLSFCDERRFSFHISLFTLRATIFGQFFALAPLNVLHIVAAMSLAHTLVLISTEHDRRKYKTFKIDRKNKSRKIEKEEKEDLHNYGTFEVTPRKNEDDWYLPESSFHHHVLQINNKTVLSQTFCLNYPIIIVTPR